MKPYLNQVSGKIEKDINLFTGGLNTYVNKAFIDDTQLSYAMNVGMYEPPKLSTRPSRLTLAWFFKDKSTYASNPTSEIKNIYTHGENEIFTIVRTTNDETFVNKYTKVNEYFERTTISAIPTYDKYYMCYCKQATSEYLYIMNENFKIRIDVNSDEPNYKTYEDDIYGIPVFHKGRLFIANPKTNIVTFSALYDFDNFAKVEEGQTDIDYSVIAGDFQVTNGKGNIVAMESFDNKLMIFCENSMHILYGDSPNVEINFFSLVDLNNGIGAISDRAMSNGGGKLYWLGGDLNVYEYTGAYINIISRPSEYVNGGIEGIIKSDLFLNREYLRNVQFACTSSKLYINLSHNPSADASNSHLLVYDMLSKVWWCEDGNFTAIAEFQTTVGTIVMARKGGDLLISKTKMAGQKDYIFNVETQTIEEQLIEYAFETKVYGIDGVSMRKSLSSVWFQASAVADVYVGEYWTAVDHWNDVDGFNTEGYKNIGSIKPSLQSRTTDYYEPTKYESQRLIVPKMQIERVNGFTILVKGKGLGEFFLMEREWRAV